MSIDSGNSSVNRLHSVKNPRGMSSARPPAWKYRVCIRVPPTSSKRSSTVSRALKQYQSRPIAPISSAPVPSQIRCEWIRLSSSSSVRIHTALGGTSIWRSFSTAATYAYSFAWNAR